MYKPQNPANSHIHRIAINFLYDDENDNTIYDILTPPNVYEDDLKQKSCRCMKNWKLLANLTNHRTLIWTKDGTQIRCYGTQHSATAGNAYNSKPIL